MYASTANLSVYYGWGAGEQAQGGISQHHRVSAAWVGEGEPRGDPSSWNSLMETSNDQQYTQQFGVGELFRYNPSVATSHMAQ